MTICINDDVLKNHNITREEFMALYLFAKEANIKDLINSLINKGIVEVNLRDELVPVLSNNSKDLLASMIIDSDKKVIDSDVEFLVLAEKMRNIYPKGKKPGTSYYWRDSAPIIAKKLKTAVAKFGISFTEEEALSATRRYIDSFNGDYKFMHLLKYFIIKFDKTTGTLESDFMSMLDNAEEDDVQSDNWLVNVK